MSGNCSPNHWDLRRYPVNWRIMLRRVRSDSAPNIYNGRPLIRENSQMVFEDSEKQFQFVGTTIAEPQYSEFAKLAELEESVFESGVRLSLKSGETLQYDGNEWGHVDKEDSIADRE
jgi:hypothetical protein